MDYIHTGKFKFDYCFLRLPGVDYLMLLGKSLNLIIFFYTCLELIT